MITPPPDPATRRTPLVVPPLGLDTTPLVLSLWLVPAGTSVVVGDRVVELSAGGVTIDLESPVTGRLAMQLIDEDETVRPGMTIAEFEVDA